MHKYLIFIILFASATISNAQQTLYVQTGQIHQGEKVKLEVVYYKPRGNGPYPLVVFNHGSADGTSPSVTQFHKPFANFFTRRGYVVAFPQRRGRGKSGGAWDGVSGCQTGATMRNAVARRVEDIHNSILALRTLDWVSNDRVLLAGQSWGGALSLAYAGTHPEVPSAVVNFVGGWSGRICATSSSNNKYVLGMGSEFPRNTIWLYGENDPYYSISSSREVFDHFLSRGGRGQFHTFQVPNGNGHFVIGYDRLWSRKLVTFLDLNGL
jgi:dienelactone hydrolase